MHLPDGLTEPDFLRGHWQKEPLIMRGALDAVEPAMSPDELAWLATQHDVESRLVFTEHRTQGDPYRVEHGPFSAETLEKLPDRNWTLLVQDVEKHLPVFRALLAHVPFLPDWRIDDLMISAAAPGGSVGPHRDNYDVFLCQGIGTRNWRLGDPRDVTVDSASHELSLLEPFAAITEFDATEGDVLYLPPGIPHWGVAKSLCITYSIGMRAPVAHELALACERLFPPDNDSPPASDRATLQFLTDRDLDVAEVEPGQIAEGYIRRLRDQSLLPESLDDDQLAIVLGVVATDPKAWLAPDGMETDEAQDLLSRTATNYQATVHGMARIAWYGGRKNRYFFANGFHRNVSDKQYRIIRHLKERGGIAVAQLRADVEALELAVWMLERGVFDTDTDWT